MEKSTCCLNKCHSKLSKTKDQFVQLYSRSCASCGETLFRRDGKPYQLCGYKISRDMTTNNHIYQSIFDSSYF